MQHKYASPIVAKYGGAALPAAGQTDPTLAEIAALRERGDAVILIHGGGPEIDEALRVRGIDSERIDGHRVTDEQALAVVEATLCGTINKRLVRLALVLGLRAVGISGEDGGLLRARRAWGAGGEDLGFVGEIEACDPAILHALLEHAILPVVAPLAISQDGAHAYNVNADLAAAAIAAALRARAFVVLTNVPRVLADPDDERSGIERMTPDEARAFATNAACRSSMKPKVLAAAIAVEDGAEASYICGAGTGAISRALAGDATIVA
ncbi:MAG: acetylglutamate kinase [Candidatus Tyrphobacter sp.]